MKKLFEGIVKNTGNLIFLCIVALTLIVTIALVRTNLFNPINRVYSDYDKIIKISTDYENETIEITVASKAFFDPGTTTVYDLNRLFESNLIVIDNSVYMPTLIDNVLHIPDHYN